MLTNVVVWLNGVSSAAAAWLLAPIAFLPGWLSATLVAIVTGVLMLVAFKYTSNQSAIKRVRNHIKANLLALSLFKESVAVSLRSQRQILAGAARLLLLAVVPMLVMLAPMCLLLGQLALWYQARPLAVGEEAVVTVQLHSQPDPMPEVELQALDGITVTTGPVRVPQKRFVCWNVRAAQPGYHQLAFVVDGKSIEKEIAVGDGYMRASLQRPPHEWTAALLHPWEHPFPAESVVQSIEIAYPERSSWTSGTGHWLWYWFVVSMAAAFAAKPILGVNL